MDPTRSGIKATQRPPTHFAKTKPATPPSPAKSTLSVSSCLTSRIRPAPSAKRTAISFWRAVALESSRLATFAQAIKSTRPTTAIKMRSGSENCLRNADKP
jgi:hypothetical protein